MSNEEIGAIVTTPEERLPGPRAQSWTMPTRQRVRWPISTGGPISSTYGSSGRTHR